MIMKNRPSVTLSRLRRIIREELASQPSAGDSGLGKAVSDVVTIFANKMRSMFPNQQVDETIKREADQLRTQILAQIKASAAQVKTSVKQPS